MTELKTPNMQLPTLVFFSCRDILIQFFIEYMHIVYFRPELNGLRVYKNDAYPDEDDNEDDEEDETDSKFCVEMAWPAFFISSAISNSEDTSTRETLNTLSSKKYT